MEITPLLWGITIAVIVGLLAFDYIFHVRKAHLPTIREAAIWSAIEALGLELVLILASIVAVNIAVFVAFDRKGYRRRRKRR